MPNDPLPNVPATNRPPGSRAPTDGEGPAGRGAAAVALRIRAASGGKQLECSIAKAVARRLDGSGVLSVLTPSGRAGVVRVMPRSRQSGELGVPPLLRRALRLVPGDLVTVSATALGTLTRVVVEPDADLSAFDLRAVGDGLKQTLIAEAIPVFGGLVFYAGLP